MNIETALSLCRSLTGVNEVSERQVRSGLEQAAKHWSEEHIRRLLETYKNDGIGTVMDDSDLAGIARALTYWLYTGILPDREGKNVESGRRDKPRIETPEDYFESLVWRVIQAHPRALSGGYYGHWHYPPEDAHGT